LAPGLGGPFAVELLAVGAAQHGTEFLGVLLQISEQAALFFAAFAIAGGFAIGGHQFGGVLGDAIVNREPHFFDAVQRNAQFPGENRIRFGAVGDGVDQETLFAGAEKKRGGW
jgi:hypothetical protein